MLFLIRTAKAPLPFLIIYSSTHVSLNSFGEKRSAFTNILQIPNPLLDVTSIPLHPPWPPRPALSGIVSHPFSASAQWGLTKGSLHYWALKAPAPSSGFPAMNILCLPLNKYFQDRAKSKLVIHLLREKNVPSMWPSPGSYFLPFIWLTAVKEDLPPRPTIQLLHKSSQDWEYS